VIRYLPGPQYVWTGFCSVEEAPSPKSQRQEVGDPVEVSVKWTSSGADPSQGSAVKEATSGSAGSAPAPGSEAVAGAMTKATKKSMKTIHRMVLHHGGDCRGRTKGVSICL
jgi:hypothetical protein